MARLRQMRANQDLASANLWPSLGVSTSVSGSNTGDDAGGDGKTHKRYAAGLDARWEVPLFGGLQDAASASALDEAASVANLQAVQVSLVAEVVLNYIELRVYQQRLQIARSNFDCLSGILQIIEWRYQAGLATSLDVASARTSLEQGRASIFTLESEVAASEHRLAVLAGLTPGAPHERLAITQPLPVPPRTIAVGIPADTLRQRPDVRAAELSLRAEIARTEERAADREPSLVLAGDIGLQASDLALLGSGSLVRSLSATLAANLFDGGRIRARFQAQDAVREQALVAYEKAILLALEDVENALASYATGRDRYAALRTAAEEARSASQLALVQQQSGLVDYQKVLESERTRLSADESLLLAEGEVLAATVSLYKAMGGGWQSATKEEEKNHE
jgi:multidrug efflux system outer membrane protein